MTSRKDKIVDAAAEMFLEEGIRSVRMDDIAEKLGVSKRTLYEIFADKQNLIEQSLKHLLQKKHRRIVEEYCLCGVGGNVIEEIFLAIDDVKRNGKDALLVGNLKKFYPEIFLRMEEEMYKFRHEVFDKLLRHGIEQGLLLPDMDRELALMTINFTISALFDEKNVNFAPLKNVPVQRMMQYVIVNFFRGLATTRGIEVIDELVEKNRK